MNIVNICSVKYVATTNTTGYFQCDIGIVLEYAKEPGSALASSQVISVDGMWFDSQGQPVLVDTQGIYFNFILYIYCRMTIKQ
jgi:hypothetical protein